MIRGINHVTLSVSQLEPAIGFYRELLGCRLLARWNTGAYLLAGSLWLALIVDEAVRPGPLPEYSHFAFDVEPDAFSVLTTRLLSAGVRIWKDNRSEGDSLYFLDPDGHKLELHATSLADRLASLASAPYAGLELYADQKDPS